MYDVLPEVLHRSRRGICPTCGAPLKLEGAARDVRCEFCGGQCALQHRLRRLEPQMDGPSGPVPAPAKGATRWLKLLGRREKCECPGCGSEFEPRADHSIQRCPWCGSESKLEARLVALHAHEVQAPQCRTRADQSNQQRGLIDYPWNIGTEQVIWRMMHEPDDAQRAALAASFNRWLMINPTTAHFLPHMLEQINRDNDLVAFSAADAIGKLLCSDEHNFVVPVLQACAAVVLQPGCRRCILSELALGDGVCVKLLLDAAEAAQTRGDRDYACHALWGVNTLFGRNFPQHETMAEIVLYRMFYLTGTVLGWAVYIFQGGFHAGYRLPWPKLLRALDDFAVERPELLPQLRKCLRAADADDATEYRRRLAALREVGEVARAAGAQALLGSPPGDDGALALEAMQLLHPLLDHPVGANWAVMGARELIKQCKMVPQTLRDFIREHREHLPMEIKRELRWKGADEGVLPREEKYSYTSDPRDEPAPEIKQLMADWGEGIRAAVDHHRKLQASLLPQMQAARKVDVPVFLADGPATIPLKAPPPPEPKPAPAVQPASTPVAAPPPDASRVVNEIQRLQQEFTSKAVAISQAAAKAATPTAQAEASRQLAELGQQLQQDIRRAMETPPGK